MVYEVNRTSGILYNLAGLGWNMNNYTGDGGPASQAQLGSPSSLAYDNIRNRLYVADMSHLAIRVIDLNPSMVTPKPTPSAALTTTIAPTTTLMPTTTTLAPTKAPVSSTAAPTGAPIPTNPPIVQITQGTITSQVTGNITLLPPPVVNNSLVLYTSANVTSVLPVSFATNASIPKEAVVTQVAVSFSVTYIASAARIAVILSDTFGEQAGNVTVDVNKAGAVVVDMKSVLAAAVSLYQRDFTIRAIRGSILKVSLGIETPDVAVNIDPNVQSTISYSIIATPTPTNTPTPQSSLPTLENASLSVGAIIGIVVGSVAGVALLVTVVVVVIVVIITAIVLKKKKVSVQEKKLFQTDNMDI